MKVINTIVFLFLISSTFSQLNFYQEIFHGGVTGGGYNPEYENQIGSINLNIANGSSIRRAFLFTTVFGNPENSTLYLNGNLIQLNASESLDNEFQIVLIGSTVFTAKILIADVTNLINPMINNYTLVPPQNQSNNALEGYFSEYYLYVAYDNSSLSKVDANIIVNNQNANDIVSYNLNNLNAIDTNNDVALSINAAHFCDTIVDGSIVFINGNDIGIIGGQEYNSNIFCTGVSGSFNYQNNSFIGLGDDVANSIMSGPDALANIKYYLLSNNLINVQFDYQSNLGPKSNPILELFLTYTSSCDTFSFSVPNDTIVCQGETLQLFATGANSTGTLPAYEWTPATGLSCSTCPNPVFTADSSMFYTVRIRNNDSCSVVRPVKIIVKPKPQIASISTIPSECGTANGSITVTSPSSIQTPVTYSINGSLPQTNSIFSNLSASNYTVALIDGFGCQSEDSLVQVGTINSTIANFTVSPSSGAAPLAVELTNNSQNASNFDWSVNGTSLGSSLPNYTFDTSGMYTIILVAWQFDQLCADTFSLSISVYDSIMLQLPNVFTPNNDGINDYFAISSNFELRADLHIFNRWGNEVFTYSGNINAGTTNLWNGKDIYTELSVWDGTYFYKITFSDPEILATPFEKGTFPIKKDGFVDVR